MSPLAAVLGSVPYFAPLDPTTLEELASRAREQRFEAGELILSEGDASGGLSIVVRGRVKVFKLSEDGREQVLRILGPGRTFNDVTLFDGRPNPASAAALEQSTVAVVPAHYVHDLVRSRSEMAAAVIKVLATRLRAMTEMVEDLALRGVTARVARLLLECNAGAPPLEEGAGSHCGQMTQQQLAAMTGTVREVVQRALKTLERDGAIELSRGRIRVLVPGILATWSASSK